MAARRVGVVIPLEQAADAPERFIGGKAARLAALGRAGFRVPRGFCVTAAAYERFLAEAALADRIAMELGRKPFEALRWEEVWDAALRIRTAFLAAPVPRAIAQAVRRMLRRLRLEGPLAVRSSAPGEDSATRAFAGLHESVVGVAGDAAVMDAIRVVWASLWSDAAMLYRQELGLDPRRSRMAVVVQEVVSEDRSGVAFGRDPRVPAEDCEVIEAVAGLCADLVDGAVDPDRWRLRRSSGEIVEWRAGDRPEGGDPAPLLGAPDLAALHGAIGRVERAFGWPPDLEWTGRADRLTVLQARPVTTAAAADPGDKRAWYLTLRPGPRRLRELRRRVTEELIPQLEEEGARLAEEPVETLDEKSLADAVEARREAVVRWRQIYEESFIPFAHGVRRLGQYYNDAVRPRDPYEFVGLLRDQGMLAFKRNRALADLAAVVRRHAPLQEALRAWAEGAAGSPRPRLDARSGALGTAEGAAPFLDRFQAVLAGFMDTTYRGERLAERPDLVVRSVLELASVPEPAAKEGVAADADSDLARALEERLMAAVGEARRGEAQEVLDVARVSWRLRDDDNVLLGRVESQLLRAVHAAGDRLRAAGRLRGPAPGEAQAPQVVEALRDPSRPPLVVASASAPAAEPARPVGTSPRQLVGQPASPGMASGRVRRIREAEDLGRFQRGEVLVCDAIQPTMTHLVPLAAAVVERRGGMLIHGAIIARELGIPCVNGVANAAEILEDGELVSVDGHLGIVTVGAPEFDLERQAPRPGGD